MAWWIWAQTTLRLALSPLPTTWTSRPLIRQQAPLESVSLGRAPLACTGDINVLSSPGGFNSGSNSIATNLDFGGGTQVIRISGGSIFTLQAALQLTGVLSNGSLLKTYGFNPYGMMVAADGIGIVRQ